MKRITLELPEHNWGIILDYIHSNLQYDSESEEKDAILAALQSVNTAGTDPSAKSDQK